MKKILFILFFATCLLIGRCHAQAADIKKLKDQNIAMQTSIAQLNAALVKMINLYAEKDRKIDLISDSIRILRFSIQDSIKKYQTKLKLQGTAVSAKQDTIIIR